MWFPMGLIRAHDNRSESAQVASNNMTCVSYVRNNDSVAFHISSGCVCVCVCVCFFLFFIFLFILQQAHTSLWQGY